MDDTGKCLMFNVRDHVWRYSESSTLAALAGLESQTIFLLQQCTIQQQNII